MWKALICNLTHEVFWLFASEAESSRPLHCWLSLRGSCIGQRDAIQQTNHRSDLRADLPAVRYEAGPFSLWVEIPQLVFAQEKCVAGYHGSSYQQTENITIGHYSWNISFLGCKIQMFYGNIYFYYLTLGMNPFILFCFKLPGTLDITFLSRCFITFLYRPCHGFYDSRACDIGICLTSKEINVLSSHNL